MGAAAVAFRQRWADTNTSDRGHDSADDLAEGSNKSNWLEKASNRECNMVRKWSRTFFGRTLCDHRRREKICFVWLPKPLLASGSDPPQHKHELGHAIFEKQEMAVFAAELGQLIKARGGLATTYKAGD